MNIYQKNTNETGIKIDIIDENIFNKHNSLSINNFKLLRAK